MHFLLFTILLIPFCQLYGLYKIVKDGPAPSNAPVLLGKTKPRGSVILNLKSESSDASEDTAETVAAKQLKAWQDCGKMSTVEAMRTFVVTLYTVQPQWNYRLK